MSFPKPLKKFDFDFALSQHVQVVRQKLHHTSTIIEGILRIVDVVSSHAETVRAAAGTIPIALHEIFLGELRNISRNLLAHQSTTRELLNVSADINATVRVPKAGAR